MQILNPISAALMFSRMTKLRTLPEEELHGMFLDSKFNFLGIRDCFRHDYTYWNLPHPRTVNSEFCVVPDQLKLTHYCYTLKAAYIILAHNHPSGQAGLSPADVQYTGWLMSYLESLHLTTKVLDHIVIGVGSTEIGTLVVKSDQMLHDFTSAEYDDHVNRNRKETIDYGSSSSSESVFDLVRKQNQVDSRYKLHASIMWPR